MRSSDISPEYPLLGFLSQSPAHGYELNRRLDEELKGIWNLSQSQVYNIIKRLEAQGDITSEIQQGEAGPDKRLLTLASRGEGRFNRWLEEPTPGSTRAVRIEFLTRLYFARRRNKNYALNLLKNQKQSLGKDIERLRGAYDKIRPDLMYYRLSAQFRLRQLESCLEWLDDCRENLEKTEN